MKLFQVVAEAPCEETVMLYVIADEPDIALRMVMEDQTKRLQRAPVVQTADAVSDFAPRIVAIRPLQNRMEK